MNKIIILLKMFLSSATHFKAELCTMGLYAGCLLTYKINSNVHRTEC